MKILHLDIETAPNLAHVWSLWKVTVSLNQLMVPGYVLCWAAKWDGEDPIYFERVRHKKDGTVNAASRRKMLRRVHELLSEADAVVTYNGAKFDVPTLNAEFAQADLLPPAPYHQIDLYKTVKRRFRFPSNKLAYVAHRLGVGRKVKHEGHTLWTRCMNEEDAAWAKMEKYNRGDVRLTERVYAKLLPWIPNHPNRALFQEGSRPCCPNCGGTRLKSKGLRTTRVQTYRRYQCRDCGAWARDNVKQSVPIQRRPA